MPVERRPTPAARPRVSCVSGPFKATTSGTNASATYSLTGLPAGSYIAYPGYCRGVRVAPPARAALR